MSTRLNRFKYFMGEELFAKYTTLYTSLDEVLLRCTERTGTLGVVPSGHEPWQARYGGDKRETSPLKELLPGFAWWIKCVSDYGKDEPFVNYLGEMRHPFDAFAFAEMKAKQAADRNESWNSYYVELHGMVENGCRKVLDTLPANYLTDLRRARDRAEQARDRQRQRKAA